MITDELRQAVDQFHRLIADLPETALVEKAWGPKEALAHLVFWLESYVLQVEAILAEIKKLRETVAAFCHFIQEVPEAELAEQVGWPKEVLAHLVFWHERYVAQIEAMLTGEPFAGPEGRLNDLNTLAVEASQGRAIEELLQRFQAADERLREFGRTLDPQNVILEVQSHLHTLDGAISSIETHIRNHHHKLVRSIGRRRESHAPATPDREE